MKKKRVYSYYRCDKSVYFNNLLLIMRLSAIERFICYTKITFIMVYHLWPCTWSSKYCTKLTVALPTTNAIKMLHRWIKIFLNQDWGQSLHSAAFSKCDSNVTTGWRSHQDWLIGNCDTFTFWKSWRKKTKESPKPDGFIQTKSTFPCTQTSNPLNLS